jgi:predicted dinucleotide-binding enzyme
MRPGSSPGPSASRPRNGNETAGEPVVGRMKIAVIGTGNIGGSLGSKWVAAGYDVVYGSRKASGEGPGGAPVLAVSDALAGAEVVVLAVPGQAVADVVGAQSAALAGKIVIDAVNRMGQPELNSQVLIAGAVPDARYVRAFNSLGWENFADPVPGANLFFAADPTARSVTEELIVAVGLDPAFLGDAAAAGTVDALTRVWLALVQARGGNRRIALRVVEDS